MTAEEIKKEENKLDNQALIALLDVYLKEFIHRNHILWSQVFKFFYATLVVILLPNIPIFGEVKFSSIPDLMFRIIGAIMTIAFFYISLGYAKRLEASTDTYNLIIGKLDTDYQRVKIKELGFLGKYFTSRTSYILIYLLFFSLVGINIIMFLWG